MADFSHLKVLEVTDDKTARYTLHQITVNNKTPTLIVAPATEANKPYFNALLKRSGKSVRAVRAGSVNTGMIEDNREDEQELYPKYIIKGWEDMIDAKGKDTVFSVAECVDFLNQLPNWIFDDLRQFCGNPANFTELMDVEINAGNSPSGSSGSSGSTETDSR